MTRSERYAHILKLETECAEAKFKADLAKIDRAKLSNRINLAVSMSVVYSQLCIAPLLLLGCDTREG